MGKTRNYLLQCYEHVFCWNFLTGSLLLNGQDAVTVVGYPLGGDTISVTKGIVSRIEVCLFHSTVKLGDSQLLIFQCSLHLILSQSSIPEQSSFTIIFYIFYSMSITLFLRKMLYLIFRNLIKLIHAVNIVNLILLSGQWVTVVIILFFCWGPRG